MDTNNFLIRRVKYYATIGVYAFYDDEVSGSELIDKGGTFTPEYVGHDKNDKPIVFGKANGKDMGIELEIFIHCFNSSI